MGQLDNTIIAFTTDNGAETITYPDGGTTPFQGGKLTTWEGGMRAPMVVRWPGHIKPGTVKTDIFASLDWLPTFVDIAGGVKGNELKAQIEKGSYPGIVKTTLDSVYQIDYLTGKSEKSARDTFFYYSGKDPSAVRYKNWKIYFQMVSQSPTALSPVRSLITGRKSPTSSAILSRPQWVISRKRYLDWAALSLHRPPPTSMTGTCCHWANRCG